jgi:hypothetical protein
MLKYSRARVYLESYQDVRAAVKNNSGLCHPPQSNWYKRTTNHQAFESLEACLASGWKLQKGISRASLKGSQEQSSKRQDYERSAFGHGWSDVDRDCQNSRAEALIATATTQFRFANHKRCRVITDRWISPFTNRVILSTPAISILTMWFLWLGPGNAGQESGHGINASDLQTIR